LDHPDEFLARVVEVEFNLVGRRTDRLITRELNLFYEVFMGVLRHLTSLFSIQEDIIHIEGSGHKRLLVSNSSSGRGGITGKGLHRPETLTNRADIKVDFDLVVLEGNERKGESRVSAKPEKERNIKGGFREGIARSTYLGWSTRGSTRSRDVGKGRISDVG
jgi:hypothetical protein